MNQMGIHEKTLTAFTLEPIDVGGLKIYPASMAHLLAMRKYAPNFEGQMDEEQVLAAIVIFATPEAEAHHLLNMSSEEWRELTESLSGRVMIAHLPLYMEAISRQMRLAFESAIQAKGGDKKKAGSAGGSKSLNVLPRNTDGRKKK